MLFQNGVGLLADLQYPKKHMTCVGFKIETIKRGIRAFFFNNLLSLVTVKE